MKVQDEKNQTEHTH